MVYYRLVFKNGHHGAWTSDFDRIQESAKFFGARIEYQYFER